MKPTRKDLVKNAEEEFNKRRKLFIQNVPPVTHQDVRAYLGNITPADIVISKRYHHVIITLKSSDDIDTALDTLQHKQLAGQNVKLELYPRRMMLYISGLPLHYDTEKYLRYLSQYGEVETAFLSYTDTGDFKGYGFVEFAHNRATLEEVQKKLSGSTIEGNIIYCDLVSDTIKLYENTRSQTIYCISDQSLPSSDPQILSTLQHAVVYDLYNGRKVYILEFPTVEQSELFWLYNRSLPQPSAQFRFAMPALTPAQVYNVIFNTKRKYPTVDNKTETRYVLVELFPDQLDLILAIESLLSQMESQLMGQQLTVNIIMNLVNLLKASTSMPPPPASNLLPDTRLPPPVLVPSSHTLVNHNLHRPTHVGRPTVVVGTGPVTRSRALFNPRSSREADSLISRECAKRNQILKARSRQGSSDSQTSQDSISSFSKTEKVSKMKSYNDDKENIPPCGDGEIQRQQQQPVRRSNGSQTPAHALIEDQHAFLESSSGPITRQRRRTIEKALTPYRKTPGAKGKRKNEKNDSVVFEVDLNTALNEMFNCKRQTMSTTPRCIKRLLPDPESSPETPRYIGQHSQGIGGHYADSYIPKRKVFL